MKNKNLCCRIFPIVLILVSTIIALGIWYFEEGIHSFSFLKNKNEIFNVIGTVLFIAIMPIGLFYYFVEKEKYETQARGLSLLGFLPAMLFLAYIIL
jgi:hypothetical protein